MVAAVRVELEISELNLYAYTNNDPLNRNDPTGNFSGGLALTGIQVVALLLVGLGAVILAGFGFQYLLDQISKLLGDTNETYNCLPVYAESVRKAQEARKKKCKLNLKTPDPAVAIHNDTDYAQEEADAIADAEKQLGNCLGLSPDEVQQLINGYDHQGHDA